MNQATNQWMLFGIDMRYIGQQWTAAWRELLFADRSPLRERLDEPVLLHRESERRFYQGGRPRTPGKSAGEASGREPSAAEIAQPGDSGGYCVARLLPDSLVLTRSLALPQAAEAELESVIALEVAAGSPFSAEDTVYGWSESGREGGVLNLELAIASRAAVTGWLRDQGDVPGGSAAERRGQRGQSEVWACAGESLVTLRGFGEALRDAAYRRRLLRCTLLAGAILLSLLLAALLFALTQRSALERAENLQAFVQQQSQGAAAMRETLVTANEAISAARRVLEDYPSAHREIAHLSELLGDDAFVAHFSASGTRIRIRGRAQDAALVMQALAESAVFTGVTAPQPISSVGNSGMEQFYLDLEIAGRAGSDGES